MINIKHLFWIVPLSIYFGMFIMALVSFDRFDVYEYDNNQKDGEEK